jgi:hydrogenase maturation factor
VEGQWQTPAVKTHIRLLETCSAVETLCAFHNIDPVKAFSACKIVSSGKLVMVVPPVRAVHTESKLGGSRVNITFG